MRSQQDSPAQGVVPSTERLVLVLSCVGLAAAAIGATVSVLAGAGWTPAMLFGRSRYWSTLMRWQGVPVELVALWWFGLAAVATASRKLPRDLVANCIFMSAIPIAALCFWMAFTADPINGPAATAAIAASMMLVASSGIPFSSRRVGSAILAVMAGPRQRLIAVGILFVVVSSFQSSRLPILATTTGAAQAAAFRTWYASVRQPAPAGSENDLSIVVFTDYMCQFCATTVPAIEAAVERSLGDRSASMTLEVRDFPLDLGCNPALGAPVHPGSCLMAAAIRFVRSTKGDRAGREFANWCYQGINGGLNADGVWRRLKAMTLDEQFRASYATMMELVRRDVAEGNRLGITGTPRVLINGVALPGSQFFFEAMRVERERRGSER